MAESQPRILMLTDRFQTRGRSAQTFRLGKCLKHEEIEAAIVCGDASLLAPAQRQAVDLYEYPLLFNSVAGPFVRSFLLRDLKTEPPDLIHVQHRSALPLGRWLAARLKRPYIVSIHDYLRPDETPRFDTVWGRRLVAVSESVADDLRKHRVAPDEYISIIHSGVETDVADSGFEVLQVGKTPVVGTAGAMEASKGFRYFLDALPEILAGHPDCEFVAAGAGPDEAYLRRRARELKVDDRITFVPNVFDFSASLSAMDIFVMPSIRQGLGTTMLEAMARGKPVIATRAGGVDAVIEDHRTGLMVPPADSKALADAVLKLLNNPEMARRIGRTGQDLVQKKFGVKRMVEAYAALYRDVLRAEHHVLAAEAAVH
jgi:glycosyltransferase involved in cell wall biosynthesis